MNIVYSLILLVATYLISNLLPEEYQWVRTSIPLIITILFSLYGDIFKRLIIGPKLEVLFENRRPYKKIITETERGNRFILLRLKVKNVGKTVAHKLYGRITKIEYVDIDRPIDTFDPTTLDWVGYPPGEKIDLSPEDSDFLELIIREEGHKYFHINTNPDKSKLSATKFDINLQPHYLYVSIFSEDAPTAKKKYKLSWDVSDEKDFETINLEEISD